MMIIVILMTLESLKDFKPVQDFFADAKSWIFIDSILKASQIIEGDKIIFFKQRFVDWVLQYIQAGR